MNKTFLYLQLNQYTTKLLLIFKTSKCLQQNKIKSNKSSLKHNKKIEPGNLVCCCYSVYRWKYEWVSRHPTGKFNTTWKVSVFGVILVRIFPHCISCTISPYSVRMRENADQNSFEYELFLHSVKAPKNHIPVTYSQACLMKFPIRKGFRKCIKSILTVALGICQEKTLRWQRAISCCLKVDWFKML